MKNWAKLEPDVYKLLDKHFNAGRDGHQIRKIVLHHNAGNLTVEQAWNVWQTREASAHYQVEASGRIGQLVNDWDTAWHAGVWQVNLESIGIEHANSTGVDGPVSDATLENGAHLVAALCHAYKLGRPVWGVNVFGHKDFKATACPGHLAGDQNGQYMLKAQAFYDDMANGVAQSQPQGVLPAAPAAPVVPHLGVWPLPKNEYFGDVNGPVVSHGGFHDWEKPHVKRIQQRLVAKGYVPGVSDINSVWCDGVFEFPTVQAVERFQRAEMPGTTFYGQVWWDDWAQLDK